MNKIEKMAREDAERALAAEMFFGDGAGTRRKLVGADIEQKMFDYADTEYPEIFNVAYENLDFSKFAENAMKERNRIDRASKAGKNFRALKSGNLGNLTNGVFVVVGVVYVAHMTGYDKKIEAEAKKLYGKAKTEIKFRKARHKGLNVAKIV